MIEASEVWATSLIDQISKVCHLVISLSTVSQIHAIRTFTSEAFRKLTKECPLSLCIPSIEIGLYTHVMRAYALKLRGFEQDERVHFKMHFS